MVIVDTHFKSEGQTSLHDHFANYFVPRDKNLILSADEYEEDFNFMEVLPEGLRGRVNSYVARSSREHGNYIDPTTREKLTFDFSIDHPQQLLVHHQFGGGNHSIWALLRMTLHESLADELIRRLKIIDAPYTAIHVRNTDISTNYQDFIAEKASGITGAVFIATDDELVLEHCRAVFGYDRVHNFTHFPEITGTVLHHHSPERRDDEIKTINQDAILDLIMLSLGQKLYFSTNSVNVNSNQQTVSGFSRLAYNMRESQPLLLHLINRNDPILRQHLSIM